MPDFQRSRLGDILIALAVAGGFLSAAYLRVTAAQPTATSAWTEVQKLEQQRAAGSSTIRYLCANHMAFELDTSAGTLVPGEDKIIVADEEVKRRCRLPWMPFLRDISTFMSAVSPATGYGASLVTTGDNPDQIEQSLRRAGWIESEPSKRLRQWYGGYRGHLFNQPGAWMWVLLKRNKNSHRTTAVFAGRWEPGAMERQ